MSDIFAVADAEKQARKTEDILTRLERNSISLPKVWLARQDFADAAAEIKRLRAALDAARKEKGK